MDTLHAHGVRWGRPKPPSRLLSAWRANQPNIGLELTARSVRYAPASGRSSGPALGITMSAQALTGTMTHGHWGGSHAFRHLDRASLAGHNPHPLLKEIATMAQDNTAIRPFTVHVPEEEITELKRRIKATRWPEKETVSDGSQGV